MIMYDFPSDTAESRIVWSDFFELSSRQNVREFVSDTREPGLQFTIVFVSTVSSNRRVNVKDFPNVSHDWLNVRFGFCASNSYARVAGSPS